MKGSAMPRHCWLQVQHGLLRHQPASHIKEMVQSSEDTLQHDVMRHLCGYDVRMLWQVALYI